MNNPDYTIVGEYVVQKKPIGRGAFSKIYYGYHISTKIDVAIKRIKLKRSKNMQRMITREIDVMRKLDHPNIIKLYDVIYNSNTIYIVLEYCKNGDFTHFLKKRALKEKHACRFLREMAEGLKYLRNHNIIHRDLKPQNLLLTDDYRLKISDFGLAKFETKDKMMETLCGSPLYMAPEILSYKEYTDKADLWSIGVILYEMLMGKLPFEGKSIYEIMRQIKTKPIVFPKQEYPISKGAEQIIQALLQKEPKDRIEWVDFFSHPWLYPQIISPRISPNIVLHIEDKKNNNSFVRFINGTQEDSEVQNDTEENNDNEALEVQNDTEELEVQNDTEELEDELLFTMDEETSIYETTQKYNEKFRKNNSISDNICRRIEEVKHVKINDNKTFLFEQQLDNNLKDNYFSPETRAHLLLDLPHKNMKKTKPIRIKKTESTKLKAKQIVSDFLLENMSSPIINENKTIVINMKKMLDSSFNKVKNSFSNFFTNSL